MGVGRILLADRDPEYGRALTRAVAGLHNEFEITAINLEPHGKAKINGKTAFQAYDLILLGGYPEETAQAICRRLSGGGRIVILTEYIVESLIKQSENEANHFWYIFKYVNVNEIISDLNYLIGIVTGKKSLLRKSTAPVLIGFYSIGGGAGKSVIALGASRELSRYHDKKVLYLSFEEIPAIELFVKNNPGRNIGDFLYYLLEKRNESICSRPEGFTSSDDYGVEAFYPSKGRNDLNFLTREELLSFLKIISDSCRYDYIALELKSDLAEETLFLMDQCGKIVLIQNDDPVSEFKNRKFIAYMEKMDAFRYQDRFLIAVNRAGCPEAGREDGEFFFNGNIKRIHIEKDENSFRFGSNHLDIDISHAFGAGIKKLADEILSEACTARPEQ